MRTRMLVLLLGGLLVWVAPGFADSTCMMLGWSGGPGSKAQWTRAKLQEQGPTVTIHYNWKNGVMRGTIQPDGSLQGNWIQDESKGGLFMLSKPQSGKADGWWSNAGQSQHYPMLIQTCD